MQIHLVPAYHPFGWVSDATAVLHPRIVPCHACSVLQFKIAWLPTLPDQERIRIDFPACVVSFSDQHSIFDSPQARITRPPGQILPIEK
jgi:hypothetical protein